MKKFLFLVPVLLLLLTGCGKDKVVCTGHAEEDGQKYDVKLEAEFKNDKFDTAKMTMTFSDETTANTFCGFMALANQFSEEGDKIDYKCSGKQITINSLDTMIDDEEVDLKSLNKDDFINELTKDNEYLTCKK